MTAARTVVALGAATVLCLAAGAGCGGGGADAGTGTAAGRVVHVPADQPTIQKGVDAASAGDVVLIAPGIYREAVEVRTAGITVRGANRNTVILDGGNDLGDGIAVDADRVAVENLTVRRYRNNGVLIDGSHGITDGEKYPADAQPGKGQLAIDGYRVAYVTAANNGLYGIYAFASRNGVVEHSYASGSPDSGLYIGQCDPCNADVHHVTLRDNAIGYFATNTRGRVVVRDSVMSANRLGVALNSDDEEMGAPMMGTTIRDSVITGNDNARAPAIREGFSGGGVGIAGGSDNVISANRIVDNGNVGVLIFAQQGYRPTGNRVTGNRIEQHGTDVVSSVRGAACFSGNAIGTSIPDDIQRVWPCTGRSTVAPVRRGFRLPAAPPDVDYTKVPLPPRQPNMPAAAAG